MSVTHTSRIRNRSILLTTAVIGVIGQIAHAQTTYTGPNDGDWATGANWSAGVPTGVTNATINNNASAVNVNLAASTTGSVNNLTLDAGDSLTLLNNTTFSIGGNLIGSGTLRFLTNANEAFLNFSSATASISGLIDFNYQGTAGAGVIQGPASGTLTNNGTIRGSGSFRNIRFTNAAAGIIDSNQPSTTTGVYIDANNGGAGLFINQGTIRATNGGVVTFAGDNGGDFISTNGNIQANGAGSVVRFNNGPSITGGNYSTTGGGEIRVEANQSAFLSPQSLSGTLRVGNNATLNINGTMTNNGSIRLTTAGSLSLLNVNAPLTLSGTGTLVGEWSGTGAGPRIDAPSHLLTIGANQTQSGVIYYNNARVQNNGLIDANVASAATLGAGIFVDANNSGPGLFVNSGTMRSSSGGLLYFVGDNGGDFINNGTLSAVGTGSITELVNSASVTGGTWSNSGGGVIRVRPGNTGFLAGNVNISAGSKFTVPSTASSGQTNLETNGTFTGNIELQANGALPLLRLGQNTTLTSGSLLRGTYANIPSTPGPRIDALGASTLTINAGATVDGVVYFNNTRVINNGLIDSNTNFATTNGGMYVDPNNSAANLFVNNGTMRSSNGGLMQLTGDFGGDFLNNGTISATGSGSITELVNGVAVTGGTWTNTSGGVIRVRPGMTGTLISPTISAGSTFVVETNATSGQTNLELRTSLSGPGVLELRSSNPGGNVPLLRIFNDVTLNAGSTLRGTYQTTGNGPRIDHIGGGTLTIASGATADGVLFFNNSRVTNNGTIDANIPAGMYIDANNASAGLFVNNNVMRSSAGGLMQLTGDFGGDFLNNGTISATGSGSITELINNVTVTGGTWTNTAGGVIRVKPGLSAALVNPTISAGSTFVVETTASSGQTSLQLNGTLSGPGVLEMRSTNPGGNTPVLTIASPVTVANGATINGSYLATGNGTRIDAASNTLTVASGGTVRGVVFFNNARVVNNGTILSDNGSVPNTVGSFGMYIDANNSGGVLFVNNGTIRATGGGSIGFAGDFGGAFGGTGPIIADANSVVGSWNGASGDMGPVSGAGTYRASNSSNLGHQHFRVANLEALNSATARVTAGATPGLPAGTSKVNSITINTIGRVDLTNNGLIVDYTGASPATSLRSLLATGRSTGTWFGANGIVSSLANNNGRAIGSAEATELGSPATFLGQSVDATSFLMRFTFEGDTDLNGAVNFNDLVNLARNYGITGTGTWPKGDFDYNGNVEFTDLVAMARNYGLALSPAEASILGSVGGADFLTDWNLAVAAAVPEPTTLGLLAGVSALALRRRR